MGAARRRRRRYKFVGRSRDGLAYIWEGPETGDGRIELMSCSVAWFWREAS